MLRLIRFPRLVLHATQRHLRSFSSMKVAGLISGGKDSCFNLMKCVAENHQIVALANLHPADPNTGELDSYMYQTAGHELIEAVAKALDLPLYRRALQGTSLSIGETYVGPQKGDEVEDLYELVQQVKETHGIEAIAVGAVLSDYQRVRVENVCSRLGLTCLGYLWSCDQKQLLQEMMDCKMEAIMVKVASIGLDPAKHLNKPLSSLVGHLTSLNKDYGVHVCGEGGEYESLVLDCPLYNSKIVIDESEVITHTKTDIAPVGYLKVTKYHLDPKPSEVTSMTWAERVKQLPMIDSETFIKQFLAKVPSSDPVAFVRKEAVNVTSTWPEKYKSFVKSGENELFCSLQAENTGDVAADTERMMNRLSDILVKHSFDFSNLSYALLYIRDMSQFANINAVYTKYFGCNPPPRICVEAVLPSSSLFHAQVMCRKETKETRHVQGVSHWAPSCIGPYSQTAKVGKNVYVSGQIPLVPGAMKTIPTGFAGQSQLALDHVATVGVTMGVSAEHMGTAHCYISREEDVACALKAKEDKLPEQAEMLCIVVPRLPRDVLVEWHINFNLDSKVPHTFIASGDNLDDIYKKVATSSNAGSLYYLFYSAGTVNVDQLIQGIEKENAQCEFVPIPVVKVISTAEQLSDKFQVACVKVAGFSG